MSEPEEYPFGQTKYNNFDPEQINTPQEAVDALEWIEVENEKQGNYKAASVFRDAKHLVDVCLNEGSDE